MKPKKRIPGAPLFTKKRIALLAGHLLMVIASVYVTKKFGWDIFTWKGWVFIAWCVGIRIAGYIEGVEEGSERAKREASEAAWRASR